jgi:hypothetical protein
MKLNCALIGLVVVTALSTFGCSRRDSKIGEPLRRAYSHIEQSANRHVDRAANRHTESFHVIK